MTESGGELRTKGSRSKVYVSEQELGRLIREEPDRYISFIAWEGGLLCPNPREEATKKGIPCFFCGSFLDINAECHNAACEIFNLPSE